MSSGRAALVKFFFTFMYYFYLNVPDRVGRSCKASGIFISPSSLPEKCQYSELFLSALSSIRFE